MGDRDKRQIFLNIYHVQMIFTVCLSSREHFSFPWLISFFYKEIFSLLTTYESGAIFRLLYERMWSPLESSDCFRL